MDKPIRIEGFWRRLQARFAMAGLGFFYPEKVLTLIALLPVAQKVMRDMTESGLTLLKAVEAESTGLRAEVARMNRVASEDAKMLLAYSRWCEKNGCLPTSSDLMDMVK